MPTPFVAIPSRHVRRCVAAAGALALAISNGPASAFPEDDEVAICLGYGVENADSCVNQPPEEPNPETGKCDGGGEDFYAVNSTFHPYWKARGVYFELFDWDTMDQTEFAPGSGLLAGTTNLDNGCVAVPVDDLAGASRLAVRMYLDAELNAITVRVRGDEDSTEEFGSAGSPREGGAEVGGECGTHPLDPDPDGTGFLYCQPVEALLTVNSGNNGLPQDVEAGDRYNVAFPQNELGTLMALTQFPVFWWNQNVDVLKSKDPAFDPANRVTLTVTHRDYYTGPVGCTPEFPCSATGWVHEPTDGTDERSEIEINVQTQWPRYSKKFLVAHEVGHAMEMIWSRRNKNVVETGALIGADGYGLDDSDHPEACKPAMAVVSHGLSTVEHVSAAANEGFAHFFAADVYNDHVESDGKFNYYKISDAFGFERDVYLDEPGSVREDVCGGGGAGGSLGDATGVEEDWLRLFWNTHSWINREHNLPSLLNPNLSDADRVDEARAQDIMMAMHAGTILEVTNGASLGSDAYYDLLTDALCDDGSELVTFIEKLDVDIGAVRDQFFDFVSDFGIWTGPSFADPC